MMKDPLTHSLSTEGHMYEYGEYDGLVDLDAILHGAADPTTTATAGDTPGVSGRAGATSPTPNIGCLIGSDGTDGYANYTSLHGPHNNSNNNSVELGPMPSPHGRSPARKPHRDRAQRGRTLSPDRYPGAHGSNDSMSCTNGGYPAMMNNGGVSASVAAAGAPVATTPNLRGGSSKRSESAKSNRGGGGGSSANSHAGVAAAVGTPSGSHHNHDSNEAVTHLPVILPAQQRRPTETLLQPRVRVSPLTQEGTNTASHSNSSSTAAAISSTGTTPHNARTATSVPPFAQNARPGGAKTVMSASNLAALQRNGNEHANAGPRSTGTSTTKVPPYLAPPLSPLLHTRVMNTPHASVAAAVTGGAVTATPRPATDASVKRGDAPGVAQQQSQQHTNNNNNDNVADLESSLTRSNGWVKDEVRRINRNSGEAAGGFQQERLRPSSTHSSTALNENSYVNGSGGAGGGERENGADHVPHSSNIHHHNDNSGSGSNRANGEAGQGKVVTASAPAAPRAPVWANDYEMDHTDLVGCSNTADFGVMPKVAAPPRPQRAKKTLSDSVGKRPAPFRPPPPVPSTPPVGSTTSPVESVISPLRTAAQQRNARQSDADGSTEAAKVQPPLPAAPLLGLSAGSETGPVNKPATNAADMAENAVLAGSSHPPPPPPFHISSTLAHRRVMNAVDTHVSTPQDLAADRKPVATPAAAPHDDVSAVKVRPPYSDDRRAALEAWAAFPALDVAIRGQSPTTTQLRREHDLAAARPLAAQQLYRSVKGQAPQEFAGEPYEMNYDVHNVVVQLRHRNRPLMLAYPPQLPLELDMRPRLRRQRTPRSFYGKRFPHVGDTWFRNALDDARYISSPDIESMEKREEEEFLRNGGDPAHRRNRYGQANNNNHNNNANNNNNKNNNNNNNQQQQQQQQRPSPHSGAGAPNLEEMNRNAVRMEQPAM